MSNIIIDIQYFGTIIYNKMLFQNSNIKIEQYENYQKMSFRNRCEVAGANGVITLSVPLEKGRGQRGLTKDVRISYTQNWPLQHWRSIESCYNRAPFFEFYKDEVQRIFEKKQSFLLDKNLEILEWLKQIFRQSCHISLTDTYQKIYPPDTIDLRNHFLPSKKNVGESPAYTQVFEDRIGFKPNLCILDLLFCTGPQSQFLLRAAL